MYLYPINNEWRSSPGSMDNTVRLWDAFKAFDELETSFASLLLNICSCFPSLRQTRIPRPPLSHPPRTLVYLKKYSNLFIVYFIMFFSLNGICLLERHLPSLNCCLCSGHHFRFLSLSLYFSIFISSPSFQFFGLRQHNYWGDLVFFWD